MNEKTWHFLRFTHIHYIRIRSMWSERRIRKFGKIRHIYVWLAVMARKNNNVEQGVLHTFICN